MLLNHKITIVTGGAGGIGAAISNLFASEGSNIVIADINIGQAGCLAKEISEKFNNRCIAVKLDVTKKSDIEDMVRKTIEEFKKIDILVNCAGIFKTQEMLNMTEQFWDQIMDVNLKSVFLCSQAVSREMIKNKCGKIINISSLAANVPGVGEAAYSTAKAGIVALSKIMALELGPFGINVNSILPGFTETGMVKEYFINPSLKRKFVGKNIFKKVGQPVEQAKTALFLASNLSDFITGESIIVSAGEELI